MILFLSVIALPWAALAGVVCAPGDVARGLDVSAYQGTIHWDQVDKAGRSFTFIKATEGHVLTNKDFTHDWAAAKTAGLIRSAYHFFVPSDDPVEQANHYLEIVGKLDDHDLAPMFDWEVMSRQPASVVIDRAKTWLERIETATGKVPIIYTYPSYWRALGDTKGFERYPLFIADYRHCPDVPAPWTGWTFWQYQVGTSPGIAAKTDLDYFYGPLKALLALVGLD